MPGWVSASCSVRSNTRAGPRSRAGRGRRAWKGSTTAAPGGSATVRPRRDRSPACSRRTAANSCVQLYNLLIYYLNPSILTARSHCIGGLVGHHRPGECTIAARRPRSSGSVPRCAICPVTRAARFGGTRRLRGDGRQPAAGHPCRRLRERGIGYDTIGSAGHESNALVAAAVRATDPALLHYRSGAFFPACSMQAGRSLEDGLRAVLLGMFADRRPGVGRPGQGLRRRVAGGDPTDVDDCVAPATGAGSGAGDRPRAPHRSADPLAARRHRRLQLRRCQHQPLDRGRRTQRRRVRRRTGVATPAAVRMRGQRHRHLGPVPPAGSPRPRSVRASILLRRRRRARRGRRSSPRCRRHRAPTAPTGPVAPAHGPVPEPCGQRRGNRVPLPRRDQYRRSISIRCLRWPAASAIRARRRDDEIAATWTGSRPNSPRRRPSPTPRPSWRPSPPRHSR